MAPGRLYRDYMAEEDTYGVPARRTLSHKQAPGPSSPSRTIVSDIKEDDESFEKTTSFGEYEPGIAQTTDGDVATSYEDEPSSEPVLHHAQIDMHPEDNAIPGDLNGKSPFSRSATSMSHVSHDAGRSSGVSSGSRMPEFFSQAVFQIVLHNPTIAHQLLKFGESRLCGENLEFLARVNKYHVLLGEVSKTIFEMHKDFISTSASTQINLPEPLLITVNNEMRKSLTSTLPTLESVFTKAQTDIESLVYTDIYPKFVRQQMSISAAKALGGDRAKYAGLGDCFVLTDPSKADNPIVFASDGFVKVTGYTRKEIIPRNCRFLQCRHTDRSVVRRLKASIDKRQDSVELLLNQRKDGEPFWNLLCTTPLFDGYGNLVFFLGGQINCSTTVHSASDVLRILSQTKDPEEDSASRAMSPQLVKPPRTRSILSAFRSSTRTNIQTREPGMENSLLSKLEEKDLKSQMDTFHNAYSNVCPPRMPSQAQPLANAALVHRDQLQHVSHQLRLCRHY